MKNGRKTTIETSIDSAGRIVIPKKIRQEARLEAGAKLQVSYRDGRIEIEPAPGTFKIVKKGKLHVLVSLEPLPPLTNEMVLRVRDELRNRR